MDCRRAGLPLVFLAVLGTASCATPSPPVAAIPATPPPNHGVIVSMRPIADSAPAGPDMRATILGAVGHADAARASLLHAAYEFIIREDDGRTLTVVQTNEAQLRPGDRIALSLAARTRLTRAAD